MEARINLGSVRRQKLQAWQAAKEKIGKSTLEIKK